MHKRRTLAPKPTTIQDFASDDDEYDDVSCQKTPPATLRLSFFSATNVIEGIISFVFPPSSFQSPRDPGFARLAPTTRSSNRIERNEDELGSLVLSRKRRKLLPFNPIADPARRLEQMSSLATALTATGTDYSNELTYMRGMAPRSANCASSEHGGMQVLPKEDVETLNLCRCMMERGEWPPLMVVFDP